MKVSAEGKLPASLPADARYALNTILAEFARQINALTDEVMPKSIHSSAITADTLVKTGACTYRGFRVTAATATAAIEIRDATSAGTGIVIDVIPATTAAGTRVDVAGINCETGIYVDYGASATGTVVVLFE